MGLYRLQVSQHQLQKDVTHQLSRFLVNRRDDEADLSDMVHIFFRSGLFSHGVLLSQMQNKIIALPVAHRGSKQASAPSAGLRLMTSVLVGTNSAMLLWDKMSQNPPASLRLLSPHSLATLRGTPNPKVFLKGGSAAPAPVGLS